MTPGMTLGRLVSPQLAGTLVSALGPLLREVLLTIYLDAAGRVLGSRMRNETRPGVVDTRFRPLIADGLDLDCRAILLVHNHPSGVPRPSAMDVASTDALKALCRPLEIGLFDHLIIAGRTAFSMRWNKELQT